MFYVGTGWDYIRKYYLNTNLVHQEICFFISAFPLQGVTQCSVGVLCHRVNKGVQLITFFPPFISLRECLGKIKTESAHHN